MYSGVALLDKPEGVTSHDALSWVKRAAGTTRVGHTGTLDRFATGLLVALVGEYTPLASLFEGLPKTYVARLVLGVETDTLDPEGATVRTAPPPSLGAIRGALPAFLGTRLQVPPAYSAVHVDGKRAYREARAGRPPALTPRTVTISEITILDHNGATLDLRIRCSRGTYVRALARDLGLAAGSCAHVGRLRRVTVGDIGVVEGVPPADFRPERDLHRGEVFFAAHDVARRLALDGGQAGALRQGKPIRLLDRAAFGHEVLLCTDSDGAVVCTARAEGDLLRPVRVLGR